MNLIDSDDFLIYKLHLEPLKIAPANILNSLTNLKSTKIDPEIRIIKQSNLEFSRKFSPPAARVPFTNST